MGEKSHYNYRVEPQDVDFTLRATIPSLGSAILNTAGVDAHGKGFGVDALNADNHSWVLSRMAVEFDSQPTTFFSFRGQLLFYKTFSHRFYSCSRVLCRYCKIPYAHICVSCVPEFPYFLSQNL